MRHNPMRHGYACVLGALLLWPPTGLAAVSFAKRPTASATAAPPALAAMAIYRRKLAEYTAAHRKYEAVANAYWSLIADKRRIRNAKRHGNKEILIEDYVLTQPPVYAGPPRPVDPSVPTESKPPKAYVPVVADFLQSAAKHFNFVPQRPQSEIEFKRAYAQVAAAAGLTREQAVHIYGFESGGNGKYDVQAGLERLSPAAPAPAAHAISTALGYNQLLATNTVELLAEKGEQFLRTLRGRAAELTGDDRKALERKIAVLKAMVDFSRSVPDDWSQHDRLASSPKGLGVHAMNLDLDVGPLLQAQKLRDSVVFARARGYAAPLTAAELEMMNLTGDGNGIDMVLLSAAWRDRVPTANFFQPGGYERNPVASRNNVVAKLLAATGARMDEEAKLQGARDLAGMFGP
jgi:hypothetical protein